MAALVAASLLALTMHTQVAVDAPPPSSSIPREELLKGANFATPPAPPPKKSWWNDPGSPFSFTPFNPYVAVPLVAFALGVWVGRRRRTSTTSA